MCAFDVRLPPGAMMTPQISRVRLPRSGLEVSRLGLGLSRLHYLPSERGRSTLVRGAIELGVTHFDTARLYGDGLSERALGAALEGRRSEVTIATKFGLLPNGVIEAAPALAFPLRILRSVGRRLVMSSGPRRAWGPKSLETSLTRSLRALRTDHVDILFAHDVRFVELQGRDDTLTALQSLRRKGMVRFAGVAGEYAEMKAIVAAFPGIFDVVQTKEGTWDEELVPEFTFGALSPGPQYFGAAAPTSGEAEAGLRRALERRPHGAVLAGTSKLEHLRSLVHAAGTTA